MARLVSDAELQALATAPREQLSAALADGGEAAVAVFERLDRSYAGFTGGFRAWVATLQAFVLERYGIEGLEAALAAEPLIEAGQRWGIGEPDLGPNAAREAFVSRLQAGDPEGALRVFDDAEARHRRWHDVYRDWVTSWLSHIYRHYGIQALEDSLRYSGERTLLRWMPRDVARPPEVRLRQWVAMGWGNFSEVDVAEDDEKFTLTHRVCGTCGRQLRDGCYGAAPKFAIVDEKHPITWGQGGVPVYRTHVAVMHYLLPLEQVGVPWPVVLCPDGAEEGPCRILLFKEPQKTPSEYARRLGA